MRDEWWRFGAKSTGTSVAFSRLIGWEKQLVRLNHSAQRRAAQHPLHLTALSRAEFGVGLVVVVGLQARLAVQAEVVVRPAAPLSSQPLYRHVAGERNEGESYEVKKYADCGSMFYCCLSSSGHRPHQVPQQVA